MYVLIAALFVLVTVVPAVAHAQVQVHVDLGFRLPAPPRLIVVPQVPTVRYVPAADADNMFFYNGQYWAFVSADWYVSGSHNGPWIVVTPQFVPRALLLVPVQYYRVSPGHWQKWERSRPPRWPEEWGREWADKREWKSRDRDHDGDRDRYGDRDRDGHRDAKPGKGKGKERGDRRDK
jgi:hypothetical protein